MHAASNRVWARRLMWGACLIGLAGPALAQERPAATAQDLRQVQQALHRENCPGDPAGNLASFDCNFTRRVRLVEFLSTSVTDQAAGGAAFFGSFAYIAHRDPA